MFQGVMSNSTLNLSDETNNNINNINNNNNINNSINNNSFNPLLLQNTSNIISSQQQQQQPLPPKKVKKKRNLPGNPDPDAEVIALSPKSLLATNRFICEICNKGFQRDQNLQLHRRGHNLPWKLKQRNKTEIVRKKAYVCPEPSCVHHHPSRALGDLTGIKKHFCRKHGEKKFKCDKCSKIYAVHSDWKAHSKTCGTREYRCDCGTLFSRKDSFITHRAFCDALAEESARLSTNPFSNPLFPPPPPSQQPPLQPPPPPLFATQNPSHLFPFPTSSSSSPWDPPTQNPNNNINNPNNNHLLHIKTEINHHFSPPPQQPPLQPPPQSSSSSFFQPHLFSKGMMMTSPFTTDTNTITAHFLSATALLQKATAVGATLQQSQHSQQVVSMLNGFDELSGATAFCHATPPPPPQQQQQQQPPSPATTTTAFHPQHAPPVVEMNLGSFATWQKNNNEDDTTRDFLGLTAGDHHHHQQQQQQQRQHDHHHHHDHQNHDDHDEDDMEKNMLKFTGGLQYNNNVSAPYDNHHHHNNNNNISHENSSPSSSSSTMLFKPHNHHQTYAHQNQNQIHHGINEGSLGNFVTTELPTAAAAASASDSRWG